MKKIQALALLPIIALASCGKSEDTKIEATSVNSETTSNQTSSGTTSAELSSNKQSTGASLDTEELTGEVLNEQKVTSKKVTNSTGETLNKNIVPTVSEEDGTGETVEKIVIDPPKINEQSFEFTYKLGDKVVPVRGLIGIAEGKILSFAVTNVKSTDKGPLANFAKNASMAVLGKDIKGLKIDSISGASLTTAGFNQYLSTIQ